MRCARGSLAIAVLVASLPAYAQRADYPNRPVRIIVPQTAGGGVDVVARLVAQKLGETWGQQVIVDNRPGANGIIGIEAVAKSKPDGYTVAAAFTSVLTINNHVYKSLPYDPFRDFVPITQNVTNTIVLAVHPSLPARSVKELVALGRSQPGDLAYGSFGVGNMTHLAGELMRLETKLKMNHVPYKGESPAVTALMGGQVMLIWATSAGIVPQVRNGRLRMLATGGDQRTSAFPDTPTMIELGYPNVRVTGWGAYLAPAGTPQDIVDKFHRDASRHLLAPDMREKLSAAGAEPVGSSPAELAAFMKSESDKWLRVTQQAGIYQSQ